MTPQDGPAPWDTAHSREALLAEIVHGLSQGQKQLPCKLFYDQRGSELFERICELPEYYQTRTELAIMHAHARDMAALLGPRCLLIEYGSGSSQKTRWLLDHLPDAAGYAPVDVSAAHLHATVATLAADYPRLPIHPIVADFTELRRLPESLSALGERRRVVYFPGSTIGNFAPPTDQALLRDMAALCGPAVGVLIGFDLQKDPARLHAAYNDAQGVTAEFNLNILHHINRELGGDFQISQFRHHAIYNQELSRIQMFLVSTAAQDVTIAGRRFHFRADEAIHTEDSCKYTVAGFTALARRAGLVLQAQWTDAQGDFGVAYLTAP